MYYVIRTYTLFLLRIHSIRLIDIFFSLRHILIYILHYVTVFYVSLYIFCFCILYALCISRACSVFYVLCILFCKNNYVMFNIENFNDLIINVFTVNRPPKEATANNK